MVVSVRVLVNGSVLLWLTSSLWIANGYKVLGIFPHPGKSHYEFFCPLMKALAAKGHEVTIVTHFVEKMPIPNLKYVDISVDVPSTEMINFPDFKGARYEKYLNPVLLAYYGTLTCDIVLSNNNLQEFIKWNPKFDVIIVEFFNNNCMLGLAHKIGAPIIALSSSIIMPWHATAVGLPSNPAYIPSSFLPFYHNMNFLERVENTLLHVFHILVFKLTMERPSDKVVKEYFGADFHALGDIVHNTSLFLVNTHFSISAPRPAVPGYIEVSGMHLPKVGIPPQHIEKWINESTHGVIYFSMGSMIKGHTFPEEKRQMFLRAFGRLPQRVLWKWETETMPGKPDNVMLLKWMPQFDILCHPNVKAFISHGGLLGVTESVHCGVPMLLMPQFGDQFTNAKAIEASGGGVVLDFRYLNEEEIFEALSTILSKSFNQKAKELSARFKDRPMPPLETAIYWVEYVARHRGAPHLRTAAVGMPLYKYLLLDVIAFLSTIILVVCYLWYRIVKFIFRKFFSSKQKVKTS